MSTAPHPIHAVQLLTQQLAGLCAAAAVMGHQAMAFGAITGVQPPHTGRACP